MPTTGSTGGASAGDQQPNHGGSTLHTPTRHLDKTTDNKILMIFMNSVISTDPFKKPEEYDIQKCDTPFHHFKMAFV